MSTETLRLRTVVGGGVMLMAAALAPAAVLPDRLSDTGLFEPGHADRLRPGVLTYSPQYPLWTDGAAKRRWLWLPPGRSIDASQPDAWRFPVGTRLWKEFAFGGHPVETRFIERGADGQWRFATYLWDADGRDARLAPERGVASLPVAAAPGGRHAVPARGDCLACHGDAPVPVLGVGALQLSPDRDPMAVPAEPRRNGDVDLRGLAARGVLRGLPPGLLQRPPRIAAASAVERAALGHLHGNCGHCHHRAGTQVPLPLTLAQSVVDPPGSAAAVLASTVGAPSRRAGHGGEAGAPIVAPGRPQASVLVARMQSRRPQVQMPPLGTLAPDPEGLALVHRWIVQLTDSPRKETLP